MAIELKETYFRRFFIPIIISILILCGIATIIVKPPGTNVDWQTSSSALGFMKSAKGGFR